MASSTPQDNLNRRNVVRWPGCGCAALIAASLVLVSQSGCKVDAKQKVMQSHDPAAVVALLEKAECVDADTLTPEAARAYVAAYETGQGDVCIKAVLYNAKGEKTYRYLILVGDQARVLDDARQNSFEPQETRLTMEPLVTVAWGHWDKRKLEFVPGPAAQTEPSATIHPNVIGLQYEAGGEFYGLH